MCAVATVLDGTALILEHSQTLLGALPPRAPTLPMVAALLPGEKRAGFEALKNENQLWSPRVVSEA